MNIGIYIYDEAEVLDFSGPFEVFSTAKRLETYDWNVWLISEFDMTVSARGNFPINAHYTIDDHPDLDLLIVVGGDHTQEVTKPNVIEWIKRVDQESTITASVCTGAFFLAEAELLNGLEVTTHWEDIPDLRDCYPQLHVIKERRWVVSGKYVTSGGISAGIDMSLGLVAMLQNQSLAERVALQMEYRWQQ
ncbi:DJ-1/PfpI family protein [Vibrio maerlii]|uniref:DJ-1/PfpI family protein n=1 Tax=Vibrio maerlii TaxID=2231648 RepID=UPI000E3DEB61|nr:DJ-1/PfpI family protein [Vibrio maerlii]